MRRRLASALRWLADRLYPEHEVVIHFRPVLVGEHDMQHTLRVLAHIEQRRLELNELSTRR